MINLRHCHYLQFHKWYGLTFEVSILLIRQLDLNLLFLFSLIFNLRRCHFHTNYLYIRNIFLVNLVLKYVNKSIIIPLEPIFDVQNLFFDDQQIIEYLMSGFFGSVFGICSSSLSNLGHSNRFHQVGTQILHFLNRFKPMFNPRPSKKQ